MRFGRRLLGIADMICVLFILFTALFPENWLHTGATYLVIKGGVFGLLGDIVSFFDAGIGVYLLLLGLGISSTVISVIAMLFLVQKAVFSLV